MIASGEQPIQLWQGNRFRIFNEDGEAILPYDELILSGLIEQVRAFIPKFGINTRKGVILGRTIFTYDKEWLESHPSIEDDLDAYIAESLENPLMFYAPYGDGTINFINDITSKICFLKASNRAGKSAAMMIKRLLRMVETDPDWPIFTEHGVEHRPYLPSMGACASYKWEHVREVLAPELFRWMPLYEMPEMCPAWRGGGDQYRQRSWQDRPSIMLPHGSGYRFHAYKQSQSTFESSAFDAGWDWDEQSERERWRGANRRMGTSRIAQHNHALTPHKLEDSEYPTGAGTFLEEIWDGNNLQGYAAHQVRRHEISTINPEWDPGVGGNAHVRAAKILKALEAGEIQPGGDAPDWIYPEGKKLEDYRALTNALVDRDKRTARREHSRSFGSFERSETYLIPEYDESFHVIDAFDIPYRFGTCYRYIDPGRNAPCACLWGWVPEPGRSILINERYIDFPKNEVVVIFFREYYEPGRIIRKNAEGIIEASGNRRRRLPDHITGEGQTYQRFEESFTNEIYYRTAGDPAALGRAPDDSEMTTGELYAINGLQIQPATRMKLDASSQIVSDWFGVDEDRPHLFYNKPGFTKVYIFNGLVNFRRELRTLIEPDEWKGRKQADHLYDCARYMFIENPVHAQGHYVKSLAEREEEKDLDKEDGEGVAMAYDPVTGYPIYNFPWGG